MGDSIGVSTVVASVPNTMASTPAASSPKKNGPSDLDRKHGAPIAQGGLDDSSSEWRRIPCFQRRSRIDAAQCC